MTPTMIITILALMALSGAAGAAASRSHSKKIEKQLKQAADSRRRYAFGKGRESGEMKGFCEGMTVTRQAAEKVSSKLHGRLHDQFCKNLAHELKFGSRGVPVAVGVDWASGPDETVELLYSPRAGRQESSE